ncbi:hypothetical protein AVEN_183892-1 [Araneus ventricosus]|uniref:Uncharacterized protein n=1 Tax=Araneus ventricosus TaxID=182803 RepID=A0A4Y2HLC2_ARAVE|nr:hypothetical protein AVEN_183892-1 [Araneus ventricosus]
MTWRPQVSGDKIAYKHVSSLPPRSDNADIQIYLLNEEEIYSEYIRRTFISEYGKDENSQRALYKKKLNFSFFSCRCGGPGQLMTNCKRRKINHRGGLTVSSLQRFRISFESKFKPLKIGREVIKL